MPEATFLPGSMSMARSFSLGRVSPRTAVASCTCPKRLPVIVAAREEMMPDACAVMEGGRGGCPPRGGPGTRRVGLRLLGVEPAAQVEAGRRRGLLFGAVGVLLRLLTPRLGRLGVINRTLWVFHPSLPSKNLRYGVKSYRPWPES